jgi:ATP-binding cassette subfamily B protein
MNVLRLVRPEWRYFVTGLIAALIVGVAGPLLPLLVIQPLFNDVLAAKTPNFDLLPRLMLFAGGLVAVGALAQFAQDLLFGTGASHFGARVRERVYAAILRGDPRSSPVDAQSGGRAARAALDARELEGFYTFELPAIASQGLTVVAAFTSLMIQNTRLTIGLLAVMVPLAVLLNLLGRRIEIAFRRTQDAAESASGAMSEGLSKLEVIKAFRLEDAVLGRFSGANRTQARSNVRRMRLSALHAPISQTMVGAGAGVLLLLGVAEVRAGRMNIGQLTAYLTTLIVLIAPIQIFARLYARLSAMREPARAIEAVMNLPPEPDPGRLEKPASESFRGALELRGVTVRYPGSDQDALQNVNLSIKPGESIALVGPSGSGKTTLSRLLLRLLEPESGAVLLDGHDLRAYRLGVARAQVALVPQSPSLFIGSILENLRLVRPDATDTAIQTALEDAGLADEVRAMPRGLDTIIGENNAGISGGQAQRLAIARALLLGAPVIVLDEPTSALDAHSEERIKRTLERLHGKRTVIIIAHRLTTVEHVDRVVVLEGGRVIEEGSHRELTDSGGAFAALLEAGSR